MLKAAASGCNRVFLGTDSAPHPKGAKESACGCAGVFSAHAAIELYAEAFEEAGALDKLPNFASRFGAEFYGLEPPTQTVTILKESWTMPESIPFGDETVVPFRAGCTSTWKLEGNQAKVTRACVACQ